MADIKPLSYATVDAKCTHTATFIFVHGLGDCGYRWEPVAELFVRHPALGHIKWILPNMCNAVSCVRSLSICFLRFDIKNFGVPIGPEDEEGMFESRARLHALIDGEIKAGIPPSRIVLGGLSQGGVMTWLTGLTSPVKLAGLVVLSSRLGVPHRVKELAAPHVAELPIFCAHGDADDLVHIDRCYASLEFLNTNLGIGKAASPGLPGISLHIYEGLGHTTNTRELEDLRAWLECVLPAIEVPQVL
ncbi:Phospholipase/carboxylesterase/thioesterase [Schizophyllum fasciatum]